MSRTEDRIAAAMDPQSALGFLAKASGVLAGSLDYERTLTEVAGLAVPDVADWCAIDVVQPDASLRQVTSVHPNPDHEALLIELRRRYREAKGGSEGVARVIATGEPELASDVRGSVAIELQSDEDQLYRRLDPRSYMIVPLVARGRTLGALTLLSTRPGRHYTRDDLDFAQHLARRFALAVDNARLYDEAERSRGLLDTLFASAPVGLGFFDTGLRCVRVNDALAHIGRVPTGELPGVSVQELFGDLATQIVPLLREALERGEPVLERDVDGAPPLEPDERRHWMVSCTAVRASDGSALGVSAVMIDVTERRALLERERAARQRAAFLARAGAILESTLDYASTLRNLAKIAVPDMVDWCTIHMLDDAGEPALVTVAHMDPAKEQYAWDLQKRFPPDPESPRGAAAVILSGRTEVVPEVTDELLEAANLDAEQLRIVRNLGLRASICAPLRARGRTLGAMTFVAAESGRSFTREDVELVEELARRAALSVDNARLYTERTRIAHALQAELLPAHLPDIPGVSVAVRYRAAGELNEVGGDFYDVFERPDGRWAFEIGDVSGKGAEAAAVTALARHTVRTAALQPAAPVELLATLNEALLVQRAGSEFCTVCLASLELKPGGGAVLRLSLGGHPPALVLRADGRVEAVGTPGTLLGMFPDPRLQEEEVVLSRGDTVLLYTDGVTEAGAAGGEIGDAGLTAILARLHGLAPDEIVDAVEKAAVDAQAGHSRDDIALVAFSIDS
jgi:serine phosphatase RsbU (regulator of sigma subunit)/PAS domain-containing protein